MKALRARVKNGRIVLDEPTDEDERQALLRELGASIAETEPGELIDADEVLSELRTPG